MLGATGHQIVVPRKDVQVPLEAEDRFANLRMHRRKFLNHRPRRVIFVHPFCLLNQTSGN
jgi:hypothetical protein